jgi:hypothetical protein
MDKPHKNFKAWQLALDIAVDVYTITANSLRMKNSD